MAKKSVYLFYIILALTLIIFGCLCLTFLKIRIIEGATATGNNTDEFDITMNIILSDNRGKIVPHPLGSYTVTTNSGQYLKIVDFSMNNPITITTTYDVDVSQNIVDRNITIIPKDTGGSKNISIGDVITNQFKLEIVFKQIEYKLNTVAEIKAKNLPSDNLNFIDENKNLIITALGTIYDASKNKIGDVTQDEEDIDNTKMYVINMKNPLEVNYKLKSIIIKFFIPLPVISSETQALIDKMPPLDPNMSSSELTGGWKAQGS
jgi:hypothetical protein